MEFQLKNNSILCCQHNLYYMIDSYIKFINYVDDSCIKNHNMLRTAQAVFRLCLFKN